MSTTLQLLAKSLYLPATAPAVAVLSLVAIVTSELGIPSKTPAREANPPGPDGANSAQRNRAAHDRGVTPQLDQSTTESLSPELSTSAQSVLGALDPATLPAGQLSPIPPNLLAQVNLVPELDALLPAPVEVPTIAPIAPRPISPLPPAQTLKPNVLHSAINQSRGNPSRSTNSVANTQTPWSDLENHWSRPYIMALVEAGIMNGLPNGRFEPDRPLSRAELADLLQRNLPQPFQDDLDPNPQFQDVSSSHWAHTSIQRAYRMGFFPEAVDQAAFGPNQPASLRVAWGAIVSGLQFSRSQDHGQLMQTWQKTLQSSRGSTSFAARTIADSTKSTNSDQAGFLGRDLAAVDAPITRAEMAVLLYHALYPGQRPSSSGMELGASPGDQSPISAQDLPLNPGNAFNSLADSLTTPPPSPNQPAANLALGPQPEHLVPQVLPVPLPPLEPVDPALDEPSTPGQDLHAPMAVGSATAQGEITPTIAPDTLTSLPTPPLDLGAERLSPEFASSQSSQPAYPVAQVSQPTSPSRTVSDLPGDDPSFDRSGRSSEDLPASAAQGDTYTLGAGDQIFVEVFGLPQYSQNYQVLADGSLNLPRAGRMVVSGMTLAETEALIYARYGRYYRQPATSVVLVQPRALEVAITGEVNRPGVYTLNSADGNSFPRVTQAIQEAGGIRSQADLRTVQVQRPRRDGSLQTFRVNLWELLRSGDLDQDLGLRDGDRILVSQASALTLEERGELASANFAPATIAVNVVGSDTENSGPLQVSSNTPLSQVVLAAGGFNDRRDDREVSLIRLHPNGTVEERTITVTVSGTVNETTNPILQAGDVVVLDRSKASAVRQGALGFLGNVLRILPFFSLF